MAAGQRFYPRIGGDIKFASERLARGLNALGAVIVLYRGETELAETGMSLDNELNFGPREFKVLAQKILDNCYEKSLCTPHKACQMLAEATKAEDVVLFVIHHDGAVGVSVSRPNSTEFVAAMALGIAAGFEQMN